MPYLALEDKIEQVFTQTMWCTEKRFVMKKYVTVFIALCLACTLCACSTTNTALQATPPAQSDDKPSKPVTQELTGMLLSVNADDRTIAFDEVEWVSTNDTDRIAELGLDPDEDLMNDYYIHNPDAHTDTYTIAENATFTLVEWMDADVYTGDFDEFVAQVEAFPDSLYTVILTDGVATDLAEIFVP